MPVLYPLNLASSFTATLIRGGVGVATNPALQQPLQLLRLYDFEGCPHCRLVREVLTELDLDAMILPCPKGSTRHRTQVRDMGGKVQFPYLVDPNTDTRMYESADIIRYLFATYAGRPMPWHWQLVELQRVFSALAALPRAGAGVRARKKRSEPPVQPLELYSFESSPFARIVRDVLCELELPYILRSMGRRQPGDWIPPVFSQSRTPGATVPGTRNRQALQDRAGKISIPYLVDANNNIEMAESADIVDYLLNTYQSV